MKYILPIIFISIISCNNKKVPKTLNHPQISKNKFEDLKDETKWRLFCINCDKVCILSERVQIKDTVDYGSLNVKFEKLNILNDTIEISMDFYYNDTIKCDINTVWHFDILASGLAFNLNSDSVLYFLTKTTAGRMSDVDSNNRDRDPLQPDVINYIKNNRQKLNPWFREEAKRRKVIE